MPELGEMERIGQDCYFLGMSSRDTVTYERSVYKWCDTTHFYSFEFGNANCDWTLSNNVNPFGIEYRASRIDDCDFDASKYTTCASPVATPWDPSGGTMFKPKCVGREKFRLDFVFLFVLYVSLFGCGFSQRAVERATRRTLPLHGN